MVTATDCWSARVLGFSSTAARAGKARAAATAAAKASFRMVIASLCYLERRPRRKGLGPLQVLFQRQQLGRHDWVGGEGPLRLGVPIAGVGEVAFHQVGDPVRPAGQLGVLV